MMNVTENLDRIKVVGNSTPGTLRVLTPGALAFVAKLQRAFNITREGLLARRANRQIALSSGRQLDFLAESEGIRRNNWQVAVTPADLLDRRVEITGPTDRKMIINALNSGAKIFMADLEDSLSPTWENVIEGQVNLQDAVRRIIE